MFEVFHMLEARLISKHLEHPSPYTDEGTDYSTHPRNSRITTNPAYPKPAQSHESIGSVAQWQTITTYTSNTKAKKGEKAYNYHH